jgi:hypothetical protein
VIAAPDTRAAIERGGVRVEGATIRDTVVALQPIVRELAQRVPRPRAERLSGVHNPWGHAATIGHAWRFLDLCEHPAVVDAVASVIGDDVILWDTELHLEAAAYRRFVAEGREGRYWPAEPLAGAVAIVAPLRPERGALAVALQALEALGATGELDAPGSSDLGDIDPAEPLLVIRYQPATSRYVRDPRAPRHRALMEDNPLLNYVHRPLWLVHGEDRARNDFVTGFAPPMPRWAGASAKENT